MTFVDSSGYVKLFLSEKGSAEIIDFFLRSELDSVCISELAQVEVHSAIRRRESGNSLSEAEAAIAIARFSSHRRLLRLQKTTEGVLAMAALMVDRHQVRALDAIQLACAVTVQQHTATPPIRFIASDQRLLKAAQAEGFLTWNPEEGPCQI